MKHALLSTLLALATAVPSPAATPDVRAKVAAALAMASTDEPETSEVKESAPRRLTYDEAYRESIRTGKPLILWSGEAVCESCMDANDVEFVHYDATGDSRFETDTLSVHMPVDGELRMAGCVSEWPDGHIPTVRMILRRRDNTPPQLRRTLRDADLWGTNYTGSTAMPQAVPVQRVPVSVWGSGGYSNQMMQPRMMRATPVRVMRSAPMRMSAGACAT